MTLKNIIIEVTPAQQHVFIELAHFAEKNNINKTQLAKDIGTSRQTVINAINKFMRGGK